MADILDKLIAILPTELLIALKPIAALYSIDNSERLAGFISTIDHESGHFKSTEENLNYKPETLVKVWPARFSGKQDIITACSHNPKNLANTVYGNRMGNFECDDGFKFRGRGYIMITGRSNYELMAKQLNLNIDELIEYMKTTSGALHTAAQWWCNHNLNQLADKQDIIGICKIVNGGIIGLDDRIALYKKYHSILKS